jgi:hypothetical protein
MKRKLKFVPQSLAVTLKQELVDSFKHTAQLERRIVRLEQELTRQLLSRGYQYPDETNAVLSSLRAE